MKILKKLILTALTLCLCLCPLSYTAQAADLVDPDNISSIAQYFGIDLSDPESIQQTINDLQNGGLSGIMQLLGIDASEILNDLEKYLATMDTTTQATVTETTTQTKTTEATTQAETTEATTAEATTQEATTVKPVVETTVVEKPVYITVTEKPVTEEKTEATTEKAGESTTEETATEEKNETATVQNDESTNSEISDKTIFVIISTASIFFVGLIAGIGITKYLSNKQRLLEE